MPSALVTRHHYCSINIVSSGHAISLSCRVSIFKYYHHISHRTTHHSLATPSTILPLQQEWSTWRFFRCQQYHHTSNLPARMLCQTTSFFDQALCTSSPALTTSPDDQKLPLCKSHLRFSCCGSNWYGTQPLCGYKAILPQNSWFFL